MLAKKKPGRATSATAGVALTDDGPLRLDIPRDRDGSFAPILTPKHERRFTGFDVTNRHVCPQHDDS